MDFIAYLENAWSGLFADPEATQLGLAGLLGLAVFALALAVLLVVSGLADPLRSRLRAVMGNTRGKDGSSGDRVLRSAQALGSHLLPKDEGERTRIGSLLIQAGLRSEGAIRIFYAVKLTGTLVLPALVLAIAVSAGKIPLANALLFAAAAMITGYLAPHWWLSRAARKRRQRLSRGLPDALDLLVVCTEAGLGLGSAIQRVAGDIAVSHPELADELKLYTLQMRAGMENRPALRDLEHRTGLDDMRGLVSALLQSMRFGTSIGDTLRIYAAELRDKRMQRAEEQAAKVSTKMLFPLVFCMLPAFMLVALGPPILGVISTFAGLR
jgi:tight adherence protein C